MSRPRNASGISLALPFFPAEPHRKASDLTVLRRLADDGNEEAEARLIHLALERGDVEQLRRLTDRGDVEELRRLADEGNDEAERQLAKFIRDFEYANSIRTERSRASALRRTHRKEDARGQHAAWRGLLLIGRSPQGRPVGSGPHGPALCVLRRAGLRFSNRVPHGPARCVLSVKPPRSHRLLPSEFRSADDSHRRTPRLR